MADYDILIKGGTYLEQARLLKAVALDKTGTLTEGKPQLVAWQPWDGADEATVRRLAASLAGRSDHPVSKAIAAGLPGDVATVEAFTALVGRGTEGAVDGQRFLTALAVGGDLACRIALSLRQPMEQGGWYPPPIVAALRRLRW